MPEAGFGWARRELDSRLAVMDGLQWRSTVGGGGSLGGDPACGGAASTGGGGVACSGLASCDGAASGTLGLGVGFGVGFGAGPTGRTAPTGATAPLVSLAPLQPRVSSLDSARCRRRSAPTIEPVPRDARRLVLRARSPARSGRSADRLHCRQIERRRVRHVRPIASKMSCGRACSGAVADGGAPGGGTDAAWAGRAVLPDRMFWISRSN